MKTILYKPVFINPAAYFVFPLLYDIQPKTEDFIEQAVFAGLLCIQDIKNRADMITYGYDNLSLVILDSDYIDFTAWAGKTIEISLFTTEGAIVLGEWEIAEPPVEKFSIDFTDPIWHENPLYPPKSRTSNKLEFEFDTPVTLDNEYGDKLFYVINSELVSLGISVLPRVVLTIDGDFDGKFIWFYTITSSGITTGTGLYKGYEEILPYIVTTDGDYNKDYKSGFLVTNCTKLTIEIIGNYEG